MISFLQVDTLKQVARDSIIANQDLVQNQVKTFVNHPLVLLISFVVGIAGFIYAFVSNHKNKRTKSLSFMVRDFNLINNDLKKVEDLEMLYKGMKVSNLTVSKIAIWNNGTETIDGTDITKSNKLRISISENVEIFSCKEISVTNSANAIVYQIVDFNTVDLSFEYMDSKEGIILQIIHSGDNKSELSLIGSIKGIKKIEEVTGFNDFTNFKEDIEDYEPKHRIAMMIVNNIVYIMTIGFSIFVYLVSPAANSYLWYLLGLMICFNIYYTYASYKYKSHRLPKGFYVFFDN